MRLLASFLAAALVFFAGSAGADTDAAAELRAGNVAKERGDLPAARAAFARAAATAGDADASAEALYMLGEIDFAEMAFARALASYGAAFAKSPSFRYAPRAVAQKEFLESHAEGDFAPLAALERVRRDPAAASDPAQIDALVRAAAAFPPGRVRGEAHMLAAEAYIRRLGRADDGIAELRLVIGDRDVPPLTARLAARELVDALVQKKDYAAARAEAEKLRDRLDPAFVASVARVARRGTLRVAAMVAVALVVLLPLVALVRAFAKGRGAEVRRAMMRAAPVAIAFTLFVAVCGGILASRYEAGNAAPFFAFGAALAPIVLLARAWSTAGAPGRAARVGRAAVCAVATIAAAFLVLERVDATYLESFGL